MSDFDEKWAYLPYKQCKIQIDCNQRQSIKVGKSTRRKDCTHTKATQNSTFRDTNRDEL